MTSNHSFAKHFAKHCTKREKPTNDELRRSDVED
jgi:hypothetical protein